MTINKYLSNDTGIGENSERDLAESNIIELIQSAGMDVVYIPRTMVKEDKLFNEAPISEFDSYAVVEMFVDNVQDFGGQSALMSKFGLDLDDTITFIVSIKRFNQETNLDQPKTGDLLFLPLMRSVFQIDYVKDQVEPFYGLSGLYTLKLQCSRYTYSYEKFDTGLPEVDVDLDFNTFETPFSKNDDINAEAKNDVSFSEDNPFGEIINTDE